MIPKVLAHTRKVIQVQKLKRLQLSTEIIHQP